MHSCVCVCVSEADTLDHLIPHRPIDETDRPDRVELEDAMQSKYVQI